jgi:glutaredoxin-like protein
MPTVTLYWRPMCGYCESLKADLTRRGVEYTPVDIWADRSKAEIVKAATGGDEIVPTVQVGERFLVNPSADEVARALAAATV